MADRDRNGDYTETYDPSRDTRWTNLPERSDQVALQFYLNHPDEEVDQLREEAGESRIQFWPDVGKFVIPRENTFAAHTQLYTAGLLAFDATAYPYTLGEMIAVANRPDLFDPMHADYAKNETARKNLLILWNDIMGMYMDDGAFDPGDEKFIPNLVSIAHTLGDALRHEKSPAARLLFPHLNTEHLNIEGEGAAHAYEYLLSRQDGGGFLGQLWSGVKRLLNLPVRDWGLPPIEFTPFSQAGLDALPPPDILAMSREQAARYCRYHRQKDGAEGIELMRQEQRVPQPHVEEALFGEALVQTLRAGRIIWDWLKKGISTDKNMQQLIDTGRPDEREEAAGKLGQILDYVENFLARTLANVPGMEQNPDVQEAQRIAEAMRYGIKHLVALEKPITEAQQVGTSISQPEMWDELKNRPINEVLNQLADDMEAAMDGLEQQREQQHQEAQEQQAELASFQHQPRGRRRRRRRSSSSVYSQGTAKKAAKDITMDDYALGQGAHRKAGPARPAPAAAAPSPVQGAGSAVQASAINIDMAILREIGRTLAKNSREAQTGGQSPEKDAEKKDKNKDKSLLVANVGADEKFRPDDATLSAKEKLKLERDQRRAQRRDQRQNNPQPRS